MIVGTAGHIDHGKTSLVRALTGVDTDRLPQEKQRGISIELGYAFLPVPPAGDVATAPAVEPIGFIDVPGHERLVHTMLAGATGIDFALLLVAADDGVMPQTREHLAVLSLLGVSRGLVALTKVDRVDAARVAAVEAEVRALLAPTPLAAVPVLPVSSTSGQGIDALRTLLFDAARGAAIRHEDGRGFRLAVDRAFTIEGVGSVVTGTVHAGRVRVGDVLTLVPDRDPVEVRVRSLHAQNRPVAEAGPGLRCAVALAGIARDRISRGQWLVAPAIALATDRLDVELQTWHGEPRPLRSGTPVHVHLGAGDATGTVAVLALLPDPTPDPGAVAGQQAAAAADAIVPGGRAIAQLVLREPIGAWHGDRVVLRDVSASRTIAGGRVLDPLGPVRYRRTPQRLAELGAWQQGEPVTRLGAWMAVAPQGVDRLRWARSEGLAEGPAATLPAGATASLDAQGDWVLGAAQSEALRTRALAELARFHAQQPEELGPDIARLRRVVAPRLPEPLWRASVAALLEAGRVVRRGSVLHLPEHGVRLSASEERIAQKVAPRLAAAGFEGAWARDLARETQEPEPLMRTTLSRLAQRGELHQVVRDLFYAPATIERLATIAREAAHAGGGEVRAAAFRDRTGLGRKRAIQVLEYFDRVGVLRRVGDGHRLRTDSSLFASAST